MYSEKINLAVYRNDSDAEGLPNIFHLVVSSDMAKMFLKRIDLFEKISSVDESIKEIHFGFLDGTYFDDISDEGIPTEVSDEPISGRSAVFGHDGVFFMAYVQDTPYNLSSEPISITKLKEISIAT